MILVVVGLQGSGKSTVAKILRDKGIRVIEIGDIWRELVKKAGIPMSDTKATREFTMQLREEKGKDIYARYACERIGDSTENTVIMGVRSTYELDYIKNKMKNVKVLALEASLKIRFERMHERMKPEDPKTLEEFMWLEQRNNQGFMADKKEAEHGLPVLIRGADYIIHNSSTLTALEADLEKVLADIPGFKI
ncbi:MAG: AAA family ATPase [Candidatus Marsarchaeota archaeon]|jgi:dephospho-CoA kinase|nr:AAA family ATPase [Candidatus Marsarchaeota archaeon]